MKTRKTASGLAGCFGKLGLIKVTCASRAFEYFGSFSPADAIVLGFDVEVAKAAIRAIDLGGTSDATRASFRDRGIVLK